MRIRGLYLMSLLLWVGLARANEESISINFTTLSWDRTSEKVFFQSANQQPTEITLNPRARSQSYQYVGPNPIRFFTLQQGADGKIIQAPVGSVSITPEQRDVLLLFVPKPNQSTMRIIAMDDSQSSFPPGSVRFFNMTQRNLGVIFDGEKIPMRPLDIKTSAPKEESKRVNLAILAIRDEQLRDIYHAQWGQDSRSRFLVFIKDSEMRIGGVETKSIPQHFPKEEDG